jgi:hypothetical protein
MPRRRRRGADRRRIPDDPSTMMISAQEVGSGLLKHT